MNVHFRCLYFAGQMLRQSRCEPFKCLRRVMSGSINGGDGDGAADSGSHRLSSSDGSIEYITSREDFKWVERLFPPSRIPFPPMQETYPSGWMPPSDVIPEKPYFVGRTRYHEFAIYEERKPKKSKRWLTFIKNIEGDIRVLEKELIDVLKATEQYDPATRVNEATQTIWIKGMHKEAVEKYLHEQGF